MAQYSLEQDFSSLDLVRLRGLRWRELRYLQQHFPYKFQQRSVLECVHELMPEPEAEFDAVFVLELVDSVARLYQQGDATSNQSSLWPGINYGLGLNLR